MFEKIIRKVGAVLFAILASGLLMAMYTNAGNTISNMLVS